MSEYQENENEKTKAGELIDQGKDALLEAAFRFIETEAGKKAVGIDLDIENLKKENPEGLSPEKLKERLKDYIPVMQSYRINGRLYDLITSEPLAKARVQPLLAKGKGVQTDEDGNFSLDVEIPILPFNLKALVKTQLLYTAEGYLPTTQDVLTGSRMVQTDLRIKGLLNLERAADDAVQEVKEEVLDKVEDVIDIGLSIPEKILVARRKQVNKVLGIVMFSLLPLCIGLLLIFGITSIKDLKKKQCPSPAQLKEATRKRNSIVRRLNQAYRAIAVNTALAALFLYISAQLKGVKITIENLAFPVSVPPGAGIPYTVISKLEEVKKILAEFIEQNQKLNKALLVALVFLVAGIVITLLILRAVDKLIFECAGEQAVELTPLNEELRKLDEAASKEDAVDKTNKVNGFTLEVQNVDQNAVGKYKRRQAVGKNAQGIVMVKGDQSFSADDTVLINELAFYIQSNNLKAY
tara:strand:+ start:3664 stop:5064 length:1401 start_codon:yes stop_codon:yes gene_type:complete